MSWFAELRQRKVVRVAAAYAVLAWVLIQVSATVGPALKLPDWTSTFVTVLLILGFPAALVLAWTHDIVRTGSASAGDPSGIAVLPFANLTGEAEQGHLADGIVEDLLTRLQASDRIRVVSRQSSQSYKDRAADARTIARELGCRYVVEGSIRKLGDRVRVTAQLIDAPADRHVWAERYDRHLQDAFALQDEICGEAVAAIESRVHGAAADTAAAKAVPAAADVLASPTRRRLAVRWIIPALVALVGMAALLAWALRQRSQERWAREEALPRLQALIADDDYSAAFDLAREIEAVTPRDPVLAALEPAYSAKVKLKTAPDGAKVYYRPYAGDDADWRFVGETPLVDVAMPIGVGLWRIENEDRDTTLLAMRNPGLQLGNEPFADYRELAKGVDFTIPLADAATSPEGMVLVPSIPPIEGGEVEVPSFFLDRFEVSNREFRQFVDASAYVEPAHWRGLPIDSGDADLSSAIKTFVDLTGRPGPSTWQAGTYPDGTADFPVTGVSWYEAAAYCRFRNKELPTAHHWHCAAGSVLEYWYSLASVIVHASNFSGQSLEPVGRLASVGPHGTYDMAGNAREWLWTQGSSGRWVAGGSYNDLPYQYIGPGEAPPADRSAVNGFRCMRLLQVGPAIEELREPIPHETVDYAALRPAGDAAYSVLAQQLDYQAVPLTPRVEVAGTANPVWSAMRVTLPTGYDNESFAVQLFLPTGRKPPFGVVFYMPHAGDFVPPVTTGAFDPAAGGIPLDFLIKSGMALAVVAFDGAFERRWSAERSRSTSPGERSRLRLRHWRQELGRTIDYLGTREDIDARRLGWFGVSFGGGSMVTLLAVEKRIGAAVLYSGGIGGVPGLPDGEQPFNYLPRVTQPVLMLNGRWDIDSEFAGQQRMLELLGTPTDRKKHLVFEAGHGNLPRFQVERATLDWFDRHLGAPTRQ